MSNEDGEELDFKLYITVEKAKITRILESKQDPYVTLRLGDQVFSTKPQMDVATNPFFNETFMLDIKGDSELNVELYDYDDPTKSDLIGKGICSVKGLKPKVLKNFDVQVSHRHKVAGTVFLKIKIDEAPKPEIKEEKKIEPIETKIEEKPEIKPEVKIIPKSILKPIKKLKKLDRSSIESFQFVNYFYKDPNLSKILSQGLLELHRTKPKNPIIALGEYLLNYSEN